MNLTLILLLLELTLTASASASPLASKSVANQIWRGKTVNAARWGFNRTNATAALQGAINSGARKVTVPNIGQPWIVDPIFLASDQELFLEKGVVIAARPGGFTGLNDCLLKADKRRNVTISGYGATLLMQKAEYTRGEWRMGLDLESCANVKVLGVTLKDSGGDGIYLGNSDPQQPYCRDVLIRDCVMDNHRRQGLSVISAVNLLVEGCTFHNTTGTAPQAGVDLEPNQALEKLVNCRFRNCTMENNQGAGVLIYLERFNETTEPISIRFDRCRVLGGNAQGIGVGDTKKSAPEGSIEFRRCTVENCQGPGLEIFRKAKDAASVRFTKCEWNKVARQEKEKAPLLFSPFSSKSDLMVGNVEFKDCAVTDDRDRPVLAMGSNGGTNRIAELRGKITVRNRYPARIAIGEKASEITLRLVAPWK